MLRKVRVRSGNLENTSSAPVQAEETAPVVLRLDLSGRLDSTTTGRVAFAAEPGTMKVREEIDALAIMGLDPVRFLLVTRVVAAFLMTPVLAIFSDLLGVIWGRFSWSRRVFQLWRGSSWIPGPSEGLMKKSKMNIDRSTSPAHPPTLRSPE